MRQHKKFLFFISLCTAVVAIPAVLAQGTSGGGFDFTQVLAPLTGIITGLFKLFTDNPAIWIRVGAGVLVGAAAFTVASLLPQMKEEFRLKMVISVAFALVGGLIFSLSFLARVFGGALLYGLALLMGLALLGTVYICWTVFDSEKLKVGSKIFNAMRYWLPALILLAFLGMFGLATDVFSSNTGANSPLFNLPDIDTSSLTGGGAFTQFTFWVEALVNLAIFLLGLGGLIALLVGGGGAVAGAARKSFGFAGKKWNEAKDVTAISQMIIDLKQQLTEAKSVTNDDDKFSKAMDKAKKKISKLEALDQLLRKAIMDHKTLAADTRRAALGHTNQLYRILRAFNDKLEQLKGIAEDERADKIDILLASIDNDNGLGGKAKKILAALKS